MEGHINAPVDATYIVVRPSPKMAGESESHFWRWTLASSLALGRKLVLVDLCERPILPTSTDWFFFAYYESADLDLYLLDRVALISDAIAESGLDYLQVAMRNAGYDWRVFGNRKTGAEWLEALK